MKAIQKSPHISLIFAAAMLLLSAVDALSEASAPNRFVEILQSLKATGRVDQPGWQAWYAEHRRLSGPSRAPSVLDGGGEDCASATVIAQLPHTDTGSTTGAADNYNYFCPWEQGGGPDVVYQYTPASDQSVTVDLCGASYDSKLLVYAGACTGDPVACNDDACGDVWGYPFASRVDCVPLTAGTTYYIVVDGFFEFEYGDYVLQVSLCNPCTEFPPHDRRETAKEVTSFPYTDTDNNTCAQRDCPAFSSMYADVWYRFTLTQPGDVTISFCGTVPSLSFAALDLFADGDSCLPVLAAQEEEYVTCSDFNPTLRWLNVPAGTYYYPVLSLWGGGQPYTITIEGPVPPRFDFSGFVTLTDVRPTHRRFLLNHTRGDITTIALTGFCPGTTAQTVSHADSAWTILANGDGNDGDSIIFVTHRPLTAGSIGTFVLRHPECASDIYWTVGDSSGMIPGSLPVSQASLKVYQNTPNPFNPFTSIRFDLTEAAPVRVAVYNTLGQEVALLLDEIAEAGRHTLQFRADHLSSGVYVYQIDTPGSRQTMKMLLLK